METQELLAGPDAAKPSPAAVPGESVPRPSLRSIFLAPLASALLCYLSHYPVGWGWLAWVALVPLLSLVRTPVRAWQVYLAAWLGGLAFFFPALFWFHAAENPMMDVAGSGLAIYCSLFWPAAIFFLRRLDCRARWPLVVTVPVVWTALEYFRAHFGTGFPWYFLAHTQHDRLALIQVADLGGAYAVTLIVAAVNALAFEWLCTCGWFRALFGLPEASPRSLRWQTTTVAVLFAGTCAYGALRLGLEQTTPGPRIALVQGNIEQRIRNQSSTTEADRAALKDGMLRHYRDLNDLAVKSQPALIVWPETSFPDEWWDLDPNFPPEKLSDEMRKDLGHLLGNPKWRELASIPTNYRDILCFFDLWPGSQFLIGINSRVLVDADWSHGQHYNSAVLLRGGREPFTPVRYDKVHRVPFGEYIPFEDSLPWMNVFSPYGDVKYGVLAGERLTRFPLGDYRFGVLICFEDTDPSLARQYVRPADESPNGVDFLVNISNDGWFDGSSEHDEHLAVCRFRAVECRRSVARAVNMGISAIIDGSGRVIALPGKDWPSSKKVAAVVTGEIPLDQRQSLYVRFGDWLPTLCWLGLLSGLMVAARRRASGLA